MLGLAVAISGRSTRSCRSTWRPPGNASTNRSTSSSSAWQPKEFEHRGEYYNIPPARLWPVPERQPEDVLLHAASSPTSVDNAIRRGLPAIFSSFIPIESEAEAFAGYLSRVEAAGGDTAKTRQRATVMRYIFVAETRKEARELAREPFDWHFARVNALTIPPSGELPRSYVMQ